MSEPDPDDEYPWDDGDPEPQCMTCGGEGFVFGDELDDPLWYDSGEAYSCPNCSGSGLRKDQTYW